MAVLKSSTTRNSLGEFKPIFPLIGLLLVLLSALVAWWLWLSHIQTTQKALDSLDEMVVDRWKANLDEYARQLADIRRDSESKNLLLAEHIADLRSKVIHIEAATSRAYEVIQAAGIGEAAELDFKKAVGGPYESIPEASDPSAALVRVEALLKRIEHSSLELARLTEFLDQHRQDQATRPKGRPVIQGKAWLSSKYGERVDPFNGKITMHRGMDFAGPKGSPVLAVAAGIVTYAGTHRDFGLLVEVDHGNGYTSRYGHHEEIRVAVGEAVKRGQTLALMGSTGRSTGPHVHYEVLYKGKHINPAQFIDQQN